MFTSETAIIYCILILVVWLPVTASESFMVLSSSSNPSLLILIFLVPFLLNQNATAGGSSDCQGTLQDIQGSNSGWALVTKRLCNTHTLPDWTVNGGDIDFRSEQFCLIAYKGLHTAVASDCEEERTIYHPGVRLTGTGSGSEFQLRNGAAVLPLTITLDRVDGANRYPLTRGAEEILEKHILKCVCNLNEYTLDFHIKSSDIWNGNAVKFSGSQFTGEFTLEVWNDRKTKYSITTDPIRVTLYITPAIQISDLADMTLVVSGGGATVSQSFCVFALGADTFSLLSESLNGQESWGGLHRDFRLKSGSHFMPYKITVSDGHKTEIIESVWLGWPTRDWQPAGSLECLSSGNNMSITVNVPDTSGPAGVYSDTMTLTVTPE